MRILYCRLTLTHTAMDIVWRAHLFRDDDDPALVRSSRRCRSGCRPPLGAEESCALSSALQTGVTPLQAGVTR